MLMARQICAPGCSCCQHRHDTSARPVVVSCFLQQGHLVKFYIFNTKSRHSRCASVNGNNQMCSIPAGRKIVRRHREVRPRGRQPSSWEGSGVLLKDFSGWVLGRYHRGFKTYLRFYSSHADSAVLFVQVWRYPSCGAEY